MGDSPSARRVVAAWVLLGLGVLATPIALMISMASTGGGHGDYVLAWLLYPFPLAVAPLLQGWVALPAALQLPLYGWIIGLGIDGRRHRGAPGPSWNGPATWTVVAFHLCALPLPALLWPFLMSGVC